MDKHYRITVRTKKQTFSFVMPIDTTMVILTATAIEELSNLLLIENTQSPDGCSVSFLIE